MPELAGSAARPTPLVEAGLQSRVRGALGALVSGAGGFRTGAVDGASVYDSSVGLVLRLVFLLWADAARCTHGHRAERVRQHLESLAEGRHGGGVHAALDALDDLAKGEFGQLAEDLRFATPPAWVDECSLREAIRHLLPESNDAEIYESLSAEHVGNVYEHLLQVQVQRLEGPSVCIKPSGHWVVATEVLAEPPELRSKWLQRVCGMSKSAVQSLADGLRRARSEADVVNALAPYRLKGTEQIEIGSFVLQPSPSRRQSGSHYTPAKLARAVVEKTLGPLLPEEAVSEAILSLRVCDPAMGSGVFLLHAREFLSERLVRAWDREGIRQTGAEARVAARRAVTEHCLYGVDRDRIAVQLARLSLSIAAYGAEERPPPLSKHLVVGDALVGLGMNAVEPESGSVEEEVRRENDEMGAGLLSIVNDPLHWPLAFRDVFERKAPGFDAFVGNPPWVAYAGRAAQPLDGRLAEHYKKHNPAFARYRTLQGLFVWRAASLLRPGGRLGLVLPTSVADLAGYAPTRRAHDALCTVDADLLDFGDGAFAGVFQPCMALTSTRKAPGKRRDAETRRDAGAAESWPLARNDLDAVAMRILGRLSQAPTLDARLFGERGFQSTGNDLAHLRRLPRPCAPYTKPLREGSDIGECVARPPTLFAHPEPLVGRFRDDSEWRRVRLLIRQTARFPIAALSDGLPFRNSILAGFSDDRWSEFALLCYLNSSLVRWFHYFCHRDARQGMPQLKIGHLRRLPDLPNDAGATLQALDGLGRVVGLRNGGLLPLDRRLLDDLVFRGHGLDEQERHSVLEWARNTPPPTPRDGSGGARR